MSWKPIAVGIGLLLSIGAGLLFAASDAQSDVMEQPSIREMMEADSIERAAKREKAQKEREARRVEMEKLRKEQDEARDAMLKQELEESERRLKEYKELMKGQPKKKKRSRSVRRFQWESPAKTRGRLWNVPKEKGEQSLLTAFLRVCMAESFGFTPDCIGIWQVVNNNRNRSCNRGIVRRITECVEGEGETLLSSFRRHQRHVLGYMPPRNYRATWISKLETDCEPPSTWKEGLDKWDSYVAPRCQRAVEDGRHLIKGELPPRRPGIPSSWIPGRPIAWGGRCESKEGSCDDRTACALGYARITNTETKNAFWCRSGGRGCRKDQEPICAALGFKPNAEEEEPTAQVDKSESSELASN